MYFVISGRDRADALEKRKETPRSPTLLIGKTLATS